jgi:hypothetical protein
MTVGRSAEQAGFLERFGSRRPGRHLTCLLEGVHCSGVLTAIIGRDHAFLLFDHVLLGRLEFAAEPLPNAGFHRVLRYGRGLNTTALLALKCPAVEARGSCLDLGEKHSLVIARRAARPLDRREVERGDRLIFAHGSSLRRERDELPVTDNYRIQGGDRSNMWFPRPDSLVNIAHVSKFMSGGPWSGRPPLAAIPQGVRRRSPSLTRYDPWREHQNVTFRTVNPALLCDRATISPFKRSSAPKIELVTSNSARQNYRPEFGRPSHSPISFLRIFCEGLDTAACSLLNRSERDEADNDWQDAGMG